MRTSDRDTRTTLLPGESLPGGSIITPNGVSEDCCPVGAVLVQDFTRYCCPITSAIAGMNSPYYTSSDYQWLRRSSGDFRSGTEICCPRSLWSTAGGTYCCDEGPFVSTNDDPCCPQANYLPPTTYAGQSIPGYCCPSPVAGQNFTYALLYSLKCCPGNSAVWNELSKRFECCPCSLPAGAQAWAWSGAGTVVSSGQRCSGQSFCCPVGANYQINIQPGSSTTRYCCPRDTQYARDAANTGNWIACCPTSRVQMGGSTPYCCPSNVDPAQTTYTTNSVSGGPQPCCPNTGAVDTDNNGSKDYCCVPPSDLTSTGVYYWLPPPGSTTKSCCPASRAIDPANNGGTSYAYCCPTTDQWGTSITPASTSAYYVDGKCCARSRAVKDTSGNWIYCCPGSGFTTTSAPGGDQSTNSWIITSYNPSNPNSLYSGCCPAPAATTDPSNNRKYCCESRYPVSTIYVFVSTTSERDICCPSTSVQRVVDGRVQQSSSTDVTVCCPANQNLGLPAGSTNYVYTSRIEQGVTASQASQQCCPNSFVNRDYVASGQPQVYGANSTCCRGPGRYLVPGGAELNDLLYCCPSNQILDLRSRGGSVYCCRDEVTDASSALWLDGACCPGSATTTGRVSSLAGTTACCPDGAYDLVNSTSFHSSIPLNSRRRTPNSPPLCCPTSQWLDTLDGFAYCCPASSSPPAGAAPGSWTRAKRWDSLHGEDTCCAVVDTTTYQGRTVCCPSGMGAAGVLLYLPSRTINGRSYPAQCCPNSTVTWIGAVGDVSKAVCCPSTTDMPAVTPTGSLVNCCPQEDRNNNGTEPTCCVDNQGRPLVSPRQPYIWTPTDPCCTNTVRNGRRLVYSPTLGPLCCPVSPNPNPVINPQTGDCCPGWLNERNPYDPTLAANTSCCPQQGRVNTVNDPCCPPARVSPDDYTCCPSERWTGTSCCPPGTPFVQGRCCTNATADLLICCDMEGYSIDPTGLNCCPTSSRPSPDDLCCDPQQQDINGVCCPNGTTPHYGYNATTMESIPDGACCTDNETDCAGVCFGPGGEPYFVRSFVYDTDFGECCPRAALDCLGGCPDPSTHELRADWDNSDPPRCCRLDQMDCNGICGGPDTSCCESITNCTACIAKPGCGWCGARTSQDGACFSGDATGPNPGWDGSVVCDVENGKRWVFNQSSYIFAEYGKFGANGQRPNIEPYYVIIFLSPNDPLDVTFRVRIPSNTPLDVFLLQDVTSSFQDDLANLQAQIGPLLDSIRSVSNDTQYGFGAIADKGIGPFGYWHRNPKLQDNELRTFQNLSGNYDRIVATIANWTTEDLAGGEDIPEGHYTAMLLTGLRQNWRHETSLQPLVNHLMVVITDAPAHEGNTSTSVLGGLADPDSTIYKDFRHTLAAPNEPAWVPNDGDAEEEWVARNGIPWFPEGELIDDPNRRGMAEDYPTFEQVVDIGLQPQLGISITPVFIVAPTGGTDEGKVFWTNFLQRMQQRRQSSHPIGGVADLEADSANLQAVVLNAIKTIVQTLAFEETTQIPSPYLIGITPLSYDNVGNGDIVDFTTSYLWQRPSNITYPPATPSNFYNVTFRAYLPGTGKTFETAAVRIITYIPLPCGFCGDGVVDWQAGEQCEKADNLTDPRCCTDDCYILGPETICDNFDPCVPLVCDPAMTGRCVQQVVECADVDPEQFLCASNSCINGQCVWQCTDVSCCDDGDECTDDACNLNNCEHTLRIECDCTFFNNCFDCARAANISCAWDAIVGRCYPFNETEFQLDPSRWRDGDRWAYDEDSIAEWCIPKKGKKFPAAIVGGVLGAVAGLLALAAIALVIWRQLKSGGIMAPGSGAPSAGAHAGSQTNPAYHPPEVARTNALWEGRQM